MVVTSGRNRPPRSNSCAEILRTGVAAPELAFLPVGPWDRASITPTPLATPPPPPTPPLPPQPPPPPLADINCGSASTPIDADPLLEATECVISQASIICRDAFLWQSIKDVFFLKPFRGRFDQVDEHRLPARLRKKTSRSIHHCTKKTRKFLRFVSPHQLRGWHRFIDLFVATATTSDKSVKSQCVISFVLLDETYKIFPFSVTNR